MKSLDILLPWCFVFCRKKLTHLTAIAIGTVVTLGGENSGGDSRSVQYQLTNVRTVVAADRAFAAILLDGTVTRNYAIETKHGSG